MRRKVCGQGLHGRRRGFEKDRSNKCCPAILEKCRAAMEADENAAAAAAVVTAPLAPGHQLVNGENEIPLQDASAILKAWRAKHGFILPDSQLLIPNQQWKMWREFTSTPKALSYWGVRNLRPRSMVNAPTGTMMTIIPGEPAKTTQVIADGIDRTFELWS